MATCDTQALISRASCFVCLPSGVLDIIEAQLLCDILAAGTGGGGGGDVSANFQSGNYAGGAPTFTPTGTFGMGEDTSNGAVWLWNGAWNNTGITI
jgi:hypothetical protein